MEPIDVFKFCPRCSTSLKKEKDHLLICGKCGYEFYINAVPCNAVIIENEKGEIMLTKRKFDPAKGMWDWPGGFIDAGETLEESVKREIKEELGVEVRVDKTIGTYIGRYLFQDINAYLFCVAVSAIIISGYLKVSDDITEYKYFPPQEILNMEVAFEAIKQGIGDYLKSR